MVDDLTKKKTAATRALENKDDDDSDDRQIEPEVKLNIVTKYVTFDPQFFSDPKKDDKSLLFMNAKSKLNAEIQNSLTAEDFKASIRNTLGLKKSRHFDLLGARRTFESDDDHSRTYLSFMSKRIVF
jgi:hypothetical protein